MITDVILVFSRFHKIAHGRLSLFSANVISSIDFTLGSCCHFGPKTFIDWIIMLDSKGAKNTEVISKLVKVAVKDCFNEDQEPCE